jgi:outer membrane protein OmpA-like peptidoglycan-associated protein
MSIKNKMGLVGLTGLLTVVSGVNASFADMSDSASGCTNTQSENGAFLDHSQTVAQGGVGNYSAPAGETNVVSDPILSRTPEQAGQFLDHDTVARMGGVGNYVTPTELKRYDMKLAQQKKLRDQLAVSDPVNTQPSSYQATNDSKDEGLVFFDTDQSTLNGDGKAEIAALSGKLRNDPALTVQVDGYADSLGPADINKDLAESRAMTVKNEFLNNGVNSAQIQTRAYGENEPLASNATDEGRSLNRRAELYIEDASDVG